MSGVVAHAPGQLTGGADAAGLLQIEIFDVAERAQERRAPRMCSRLEGSKLRLQAALLHAAQHRAHEQQVGGARRMRVDDGDGLETQLLAALRVAWDDERLSELVVARPRRSNMSMSVVTFMALTLTLPRRSAKVRLSLPKPYVFKLARVSTNASHQRAAFFRSELDAAREC